LPKKLRKSYDKVLLIDDREPLKFAELVAENCPIPIEFRRLKTGDYVCEDVAIERKRIDDFVASMISKKKRLWKQYDRLKKEFAFPYILISGNTQDVWSNVSDHAVMGGLASLACPKFKGNVLVSRPITVIKVDTDEQLAYLILKVMERHNKLKLKDVIKI